MAKFNPFVLTAWRQRLLSAAWLEHLKRQGLQRQSAVLGLCLVCALLLAGLIAIGVAANYGSNQQLNQWAAQEVNKREATLLAAVNSGVNEAVLGRLNYFVEAGLADGVRLYQRSTPAPHPGCRGPGAVRRFRRRHAGGDERSEGP